MPHSPFTAATHAVKVLDGLLLRLRAMPFTLRANLQCRMQGDNIDRGPQLEHLFNSDFMYLSPVKWVPVRRSQSLLKGTLLKGILNVSPLQICSQSRGRCCVGTAVAIAPRRCYHKQ